jgi:putative tricarboxylic transport membrane protein
MKEPRAARPRLHRDVVAGLALLALIALAWWLTMGFRAVPAMLSQNVPPTFFPRLVLAVMAALAAVLIAGGLRREPTSGEHIPAVVIATASVVLAAPVSITVIGTFPTLVLIGAGSPLLWQERRALPIVGLAAGLPLGIYLLFGLALDVRFPAGLVGRLFG